MPRHLPLLLSIFAFATLLCAQEPSAPKPKNPVPVINGERGDCTADFTVTNSKLKPLYNAKIAVQLRYGFAGLHRTDLEVSTNVDGQARFEGLSQRPRQPLGFTVTYKERKTAVVVDVDRQCHGSYTAIVTDNPIKNEDDE